MDADSAEAALERINACVPSSRGFAIYPGANAAEDLANDLEAVAAAARDSDARLQLGRVGAVEAVMRPFRAGVAAIRTISGAALVHGAVGTQNAERVASVSDCRELLYRAQAEAEVGASLLDDDVATAPELELTPTVIKYTTSAARVLRTLAVQNEENQTRIAACGGIETLVELMASAAGQRGTVDVSGASRDPRNSVSNGVSESALGGGGGSETDGDRRASAESGCITQGLRAVAYAISEASGESNSLDLEAAVEAVRLLIRVAAQALGNVITGHSPNQERLWQMLAIETNSRPPAGVTFLQLLMDARADVRFGQVLLMLLHNCCVGGNDAAKASSRLASLASNRPLLLIVFQQCVARAREEAESTDPPPGCAGLAMDKISRAHAQSLLWVRLLVTCFARAGLLHKVLVNVSANSGDISEHCDEDVGTSSAHGDEIDTKVDIGLRLPPTMQPEQLTLLHIALEVIESDDNGKCDDSVEAQIEGEAGVLTWSARQHLCAALLHALRQQPVVRRCKHIARTVVRAASAPELATASTAVPAPVHAALLPLPFGVCSDGAPITFAHALASDVTVGAATEPMDDDTDYVSRPAAFEALEVRGASCILNLIGELTASDTNDRGRAAPADLVAMRELRDFLLRQGLIHVLVQVLLASYAIHCPAPGRNTRRTRHSQGHASSDGGSTKSPKSDADATNAGVASIRSTWLRDSAPVVLQIIGNLCFRHRPTQDALRTMDGQFCAREDSHECGNPGNARAIQLLLNHTRVDATRPLLREWTLWALRNVCAGDAGEGNAANQKLLQDLKLHGLAPEQPPGVQLELDADGRPRMKVRATGAE